MLGILASKKQELDQFFSRLISSIRALVSSPPPPPSTRLSINLWIGSSIPGHTPASRLAFTIFGIAATCIARSDPILSYTPRSICDASRGRYAVMVEKKGGKRVCVKSVVDIVPDERARA